MVRAEGYDVITNRELNASVFGKSKVSERVNPHSERVLKLTIAA